MKDFLAGMVVGMTAGAVIACSPKMTKAVRDMKKKIEDTACKCEHVDVKINSSDCCSEQCHDSDWQ